ncbi:hypothetical protein GOV07_02570 [Candidatus Woesearchaeota archaeon]|nr:hypothetical protein [Candidatus Woesearchaeota archaeon]
MERQRLIPIVTIAMLAMLLFAESAFADPNNPTSLTWESSSRRDLSTVPSQQVNALAGNVTQLSIDALSITQSWQGYYGNVSGTIGLWNSNNDTFYNWSMASAAGEVYASRASSITWASIACAQTANLGTEEGNLGQVAADADSVTNTFDNATFHPAFDVGAVTLGADDCYAANPFDDGGAQTAQFFNVMLWQGTNAVYTTLLNGSQTGFDGSPWDFELLVGEDGHGNSAVTPYYFFVELG